MCICDEHQVQPTTSPLPSCGHAHFLPTGLKQLSNLLRTTTWEQKGRHALIFLFSLKGCQTLNLTWKTIVSTSFKENNRNNHRLHSGFSFRHEQVSQTESSHSWLLVAAEHFLWVVLFVTLRCSLIKSIIPGCVDKITFTKPSDFSVSFSDTLHTAHAPWAERLSVMWSHACTLMGGISYCVCLLTLLCSEGKAPMPTLVV